MQSKLNKEIIFKMEQKSIKFGGKNTGQFFENISIIDQLLVMLTKKQEVKDTITNIVNVKDERSDITTDKSII